MMVVLSVPRFWPAPTAYVTGRIEKACDSVTTFIAFLIPATLAVTTWVYEKTGVLWYGASLALSTGWFLVVLIFTMYMRFNFVWRLPPRVMVGGNLNLEVARWLTTVMFGLTWGLLFLAVPTFVIAFRSLPQKEKPVTNESQAHYEYHTSVSQPCHPCWTNRTPPNKQPPASKSGPKPKPACQPCAIPERAPKTSPTPDLN
jgi:hypothetical protein